ncbi:MAG: hypothetical protein ACREBI_11185 [Nitrosotalea sp.]
MKVLAIGMFSAIALAVFCSVNLALADNYIQAGKPNLGCSSLSGLVGLQHMILQTTEHSRGYKVSCPTISGPQMDLTYVPNSTGEKSPQVYQLNSTLPFHVMSKQGSELIYATAAGKSVDLPIEFNLTQGYKMSYVKLSLSGVPPDVRIFINPNESDPFSNQINKEFMANGTLHVYIDSGAITGKYDVAILGDGSVNDPNGKEVDMKNSVVGMFHLDILQNTNMVWMSVGTPILHQVLMTTKMGGGTSVSGFGGETDVPITVYASQKTQVNLGLGSYPNDAFFKFVPDTVVATSQGADAIMVMAGAGIPNPDYPNALHTDVASIMASSQYGNSTAVGFLPIYEGQKITILHGPQPINLTNSNFGGNAASGFKIVGVIYDPPTGSGYTMQVHMSVLGLMNGTELVPIPSWLRVSFPVPDFTLNATRPYFFMLNFTTTSVPKEPYPVAIDENVGGSHFTQVVWFPKENQIRFAPAPQYTPPLKQNATGTKISDTVCQAGHYLLVGSNGGPSCVITAHIPRFLGLGWEYLATYLDQSVPHSPSVTQVVLTDQYYAHDCRICTATQKNVTVSIGQNNTVKWMDDSSSVLLITADKIGDNDTSFYHATFTPSGRYGDTIFPNYIHPGRTFEFTFTKPGKFGWQSRPSLTGWVTVLPRVETTPHIILKDFTVGSMKNAAYLNHTLAIMTYPSRNQNIIHVANPSNSTFHDCQVVLYNNRSVTLASFDTVNASFYDQIWYNSTFTPNTEIIFQCNAPHELVSYLPLGINPITYGELDRIHSICQRPLISENNSGDFIMCPLSSNITSWLHMSPPISKRTLCHSTFGCSGEYIYPLVGNSTDHISKEGQKQLADYVIKNLPQTSKWPQGWKLHNLSVNFEPSGGAFASLEFVIPVVNPNFNDCGWYAQVSVNLENMKLYDENNMVPKSNTPCELK